MRAKSRWQLLLLWFFATHCVAAEYERFWLNKENSYLVFMAKDGQQFEAPRLADQVGYDMPRISADGRYIGWLAMYPNCCTSYPIGLKLVVRDPSGKLHTFSGNKLVLFDWCFMPGAPSVAFRQSVLHGTDYMHFEWRGIADERLLGEYDYPPDESEQARERAPDWVRCVPD